MAGKKKAKKKTKKTKKKTKKAAPVPVFAVRGETNTLELAKVGSAINLRIYKRGGVHGRLRVGQGGIAWIPRGENYRKARKIPWDVFARMMKEFPFGHAKNARVKFADGKVIWRSPGKRGAGRGLKWDEFVDRMDRSLPKKAKKRVAKKRAAKKKARKVVKKKARKKAAAKRK